MRHHFYQRIDPDHEQDVFLFQKDVEEDDAQMTVER
jgi:hypothetical protein